MFPPAAPTSFSIVFYSKIPQKSFWLTVSTNPLLSLSWTTLIKQCFHHFTKTVLVSLDALLHAAESNGRASLSSLSDYQHLTQSILFLLETLSSLGL